MKTKILLPVLAIVFAVGMAFATVTMNAEQAYDYVKIGESWEQIEALNCPTGNDVCLVRLAPGTTPLAVYDNIGDANPKPGNGTVIDQF